MTQGPSVLLVCFDVVPAPTALSRRLMEYVKALAPHFTVSVLSVKSPDVPHIETWNGAKLLRVPVGSPDLNARIETFDRALRRQLESEEYALALFFDPFSGYALCEAKQRHKAKLVYDASSFPSLDFPYAYPHTEGDRRFIAKVRRQELFCLMNADAVLCPSDTGRRYVASLGVPKEQLRVIAPPVDVAQFSAATASRPEGSALRMVYLGNQHGYQGLPTLLRGVALAKATCDVRLTVVGPRHAQWQLHLDDLKTELKLAGTVFFMPPVPHDGVATELLRHDVAMAPFDAVERNKGFGGSVAKLADYASAGRPIIAADVAVARELLHPESALFFTPADPESLADVIRKLAGDPALRASMAQAAKKSSSRFDASAMRPKLVALMENLAGALPLTAVASRQVEDRVKTDPAIQMPTEEATSPGVRASLGDESPATDQHATPDVVKGLGVRAAKAVPFVSDAPEVDASDIVPDGDDASEDPGEVDSDSVVAVETSSLPVLPSRLDPWLAQVVHGHCPPDTLAPTRQPPPTNFPGRDDPSVQNTKSK